MIAGMDWAAVAALLTAVGGIAGLWWSQRHQGRAWKTEVETARDAALDEREAALRADIEIIIARLEAENQRQNAELAECRARTQRADAEMQEKNQRIIDLILDRANAMHQHALVQEAFLLERQKNIAMGEKFGRRLADAPGAADADPV